MNNANRKPNESAFDLFDDELFDDSNLFANFENTSLKETASTSENNLNTSANITAQDLNVSALCCDEELNGYDKLTGKTWIYPTNYPIRHYQFNIIKAALVNNTLVSLPTGLGKTFIAAVIMYNFYRWYPLGKIVFMAPTKPLVAQQIDACYNIIALPPSDTIEMTGHMAVNTRKLRWQNKRVIFATPQVIYNDIKSGICPSDKIKCLVMDEAHRARGNYAYCQIVAALTDMGHRTYRVLALSATPGSKVEDVVKVVHNMNIAHLELRTEDCIDVAPYKQSRKINTVVVPLGPELSQLRQKYIEIIDIYARRLKQLNVLPQNIGNMSKGRIVMLYKEYQTKERGARHPQHNQIMKDFTNLITLYHGLELLLKHGSRVFLNFFDEHQEKSWVHSDDQLMGLLERLRNDLGINPMDLNLNVLPDGTVPAVPQNLCFGHPKFYRLKEIMLQHFNKAKQIGQTTKAIVFCEYRESVNLVNCLLLQCRPLIVPRMFVGQGGTGTGAVSQAQQVLLMRSFRAGECNTLVATCVAEEGLDVGEVDLIVCFDISNRSPIRLVQRCGRTGRERGGHVYILVTEGKEHQTLLDCMNQRDNLNKRILQSKEIEKNLYKLNPRMMPQDFTPRCHKMYVTVSKKEKDVKVLNKDKKGQQDLRTMLSKANCTRKESKETADESKPLTENDFNDMYPDGYKETMHLEERKELWAVNKEVLMAISKKQEEKKIKLHTWLDWQRNPQKTVNICHSTDTDVLVSLLQYGNSKKNLTQSTQIPSLTQNSDMENFVKPNQINSNAPLKSKTSKKKAALAKSPNKNAGDIRALFSTTTKSTKNYTKLVQDLGIDGDSISTKLLNIFVDLSINASSANVKKCFYCENVCDCDIIKKLRYKKVVKPISILGDLKLPDIDLIDEMDAESIQNCVKKISTLELSDQSIYSGNSGIDVTNNFDLQFDFDDIIDEMESRSSNSPHSEDYNANKSPVKSEVCSSNLKSAEPIHRHKETDENLKTDSSVQALNFFGLGSIDDIFADSDESVGLENLEKTDVHKDEIKVNCEETTNEINDTINEYPLSPSILSGINTQRNSTSPLLSTKVKKFNIGTRKSTQYSTNDNKTKNSTVNENNITVEKSMFTVTQLVDMINKTNEDSITNKTVTRDDTLKSNERSVSPIIYSQLDRQILEKSSKKKNGPSQMKSLIVLDSDNESNDNSECDDTQIYEIDLVKAVKQNKTESPTGEDSLLSLMNNKRKLDVHSMTTQYVKRPKLDNDSNKPPSIQEKVLAALKSNKAGKSFYANDNIVNIAECSQKLQSQKENINIDLYDDKETKFDSSDMLKMFKRGSNVSSPKRKLEEFLNNSCKTQTTPKRKLIFDEDSDDDFIENNAQKSKENEFLSGKNNRNLTEKNHKRRKKKGGNEFLVLEAEQSFDENVSGDELSDESVGSIIDFICDDTLTQREDMKIHYVESIKGALNGGVFKIPELPSKFNKEDIFSQYVEEDAYEIDSFCVDSHVGLTQAADISELELAELALERKKKKRKIKLDSILSGDDSPVKRKRKAKMQIHSDSDDSS